MATRRPNRYWKKEGMVGFDTVVAYLQGKLSQEDAVKALTADAEAKGYEIGTHTADPILADLKWYAREIRPRLGLLPGREPVVRRQPPAAPTERAVISDGGRLVIPAPYRHALGVKEGDEVVLHLEEDGGVVILTPDRWLRRAQALVRRHVPAGRSLADELIAERREEAGRE